MEGGGGLVLELVSARIFFSQASVSGNFLGWFMNFVLYPFVLHDFFFTVTHTPTPIPL